MSKNTVCRGAGRCGATSFDGRVRFRLLLRQDAREEHAGNRSDHDQDRQHDEEDQLLAGKSFDFRLAFLAFFLHCFGGHALLRRPAGSFLAQG
jgi:hypothetical protein